MARLSLALAAPAAKKGLFKCVSIIGLTLSLSLSIYRCKPPLWSHRRIPKCVALSSVRTVPLTRPRTVLIKAL